MYDWRKLLLAGVCFVLLTGLVLAQDGEEPSAAPIDEATSLDTGVDRLKAILTPKRKGEIEVLVTAWWSKLETALDDLASASETAEKTRLRGERDAILERFELVLAAFEAKGGDGGEARTYLAAVQPDSIGELGESLKEPSVILTSLKEWAASDEGGIKWAKRIGLFIVVLIAFKIVASILGGITRKAVSRLKKTSELLKDFFVNTVKKLTTFIGLVIGLSVIGVDIGPFLAAMGALGFIIAFALQGTLSNFASGIMILLYRPYDIGDVVSVSGVVGKVSAMSLVSTTVLTPDNQINVVPNNSIWGGIITNVTGNKTRRVDMVMGIGYDDDIAKAQSIIESILDGHELILKDPAPVVQVHELADSSVNFVVRPWCATADYWTVYWDVTRQVKLRFDEEGVSIPFPQRDVHVHQVGAPIAAPGHTPTGSSEGHRTDTETAVMEGEGDDEN